MALVARNEENLGKTLTMCEEASQKVASEAKHCVVKADLSDPVQISVAFENIIKKLGKLDILVSILCLLSVFFHCKSI